MTPYKHYIRLSGKEKQNLRRLKKAGKTERRLADRSRIILWTNERVAVAEIAARLECHRSTVINCRRRFLQRRAQGQSVTACLQDAPRSGRPVERTALQEAQIKAVVCGRLRTASSLEETLEPFLLERDTDLGGRSRGCTPVKPEYLVALVA